MTVRHAVRGLGGTDKIALVAGGERAEFRPTDTAAAIAAAVQGMPSIAGASVALSGSAASPNSTLTIVVTLNAFHGTGSNWYRHDGDPALGFFFCDVTPAHNGLTATATPGAASAGFIVTIDGTGNRFIAVADGDPGTVLGPFTMLSASVGNAELGTNGSLVLRFTPHTGRAAGERWRVLVTAGATGVVVIPDVACAIDDVPPDVDVSASAYTGRLAQEYIIVADTPLADGTATFRWRTTAGGSTLSPPAPVSADSSVALSDGVAVRWLSAVGHSANATWRVTAVAPTAVVTPGRPAFMTARGLPTSVTASYRIAVSNGTAVPALFQFSVSPPTSTGGRPWSTT
jgi:hypothetical protein